MNINENNDIKMTNKIFILLSMYSILLSSFDFSELKYSIHGRAFFGNNLIKNDSLEYIIPDGKDEKIVLFKIPVNSSGEYTVDIIWTQYCGSRRNCGNKTKIECDKFWKSKINSDSIYFRYKGKIISTWNYFREDTETRIISNTKNFEIISNYNTDLRF